MTTENNTSDLRLNLKQVQEWSAQQDLHWEKKDTELKRAVQNTQQEIQRLQTRLVELTAQQKDMEQQASQREDEEISRMRQAIFSGLESANQAIGIRDTLLNKQRTIRENRLNQILQEPRFQEKIAEYRQFQQTESELMKLPASYRSAILEHHKAVRKELEPIFMSAEQPLPRTDKPGKSIGLIASIEPSFLAPTAMAIVVPVPFSVYTQPSGGQDSLAEILAFRCCGAITAALHKIGLSEVTFHFADFNGFLSIQVRLNGQTLNGDIKQSLFLEFEHLQNYTSELQSVRLTLDLAWVDPTLLSEEGV